MKNRTFSPITRIFAMCVFLTLGYQNCFQIKGNKNDAGGGGSGGYSSGTFGKSDCQFVSTTALHSYLKDILGIVSGDTAVLDANGNPTSTMYIASNGAALGDPGVDTPSNTTCGSLKYKIAAEIMINACGTASAASLQALFPNGANDFSTIYQKVFGRSPTSEEVETLRNLVQSVSSQTAEKAACAAVSASVEALARNI